MKFQALPAFSRAAKMAAAAREGGGERFRIFRAIFFLEFLRLTVCVSGRRPLTRDTHRGPNIISE